MLVERQFLEKHVNLMHSTIQAPELRYKFPTVRRLVISHSRIRDLRFLRYLPNLEELYADFCGITSTEVFQACPQLSVLVARGNAFGEAPRLSNAKTIDLLGNYTQIELLEDHWRLNDFLAPMDCFAQFERLFFGFGVESSFITYYRFFYDGIEVLFDDLIYKFVVKTTKMYVRAHFSIYYLVEYTYIRLNYDWSGYLACLSQFSLPDELLYEPYAYAFEDAWCLQIRAIQQRRLRKIRKNKWFVIFCIEVCGHVGCFVIDPQSKRLLDVAAVRQRQLDKCAATQAMDLHNVAEHRDSVADKLTDSSYQLPDEFEIKTLVCTRRYTVQKKSVVLSQVAETYHIQPLSPSKIAKSQLDYHSFVQQLVHISVSGKAIITGTLTISADCAFHEAYVFALDLPKDEIMRYMSTILPGASAEAAFGAAVADFNSKCSGFDRAPAEIKLDICGKQFNFGYSGIAVTTDHTFCIIAGLYDKLLCFAIEFGGRTYLYLHADFVQRWIQFSSVKLIYSGSNIIAQPYEIVGGQIVKSTCQNVHYTFFKNNLVIYDGFYPFCSVRAQIGRFKCLCYAFLDNTMPAGDQTMSNQVHIKQAVEQYDKQANDYLEARVSAYKPAVQYSSAQKAGKPKYSKLYQYLNVDDTFDEISEISTAQIAETASSATSVYTTDCAAIKGSMTLCMVNYAVSQSDSQYYNLQTIKHLYEPLQTRLKLVFLRNQFKENDYMRFDALFPQRAGVYEPQNFWFERYFIEYNNLQFYVKSSYLRYDFSHRVETYFIYDKYLEQLHVAASSSVFIVSRDVTGGWTFVLESEEQKCVFAVPICTKYQVIAYSDYCQEIYTQNVQNTFRLEPSFVKKNSDSECAQTYILYIEGAVIPFTATPSVTGSLNQALSIAYNEVVGSFSQNSASNKRYNQLTVNRLASIAAYKTVTEKAFGLDNHSVKTVSQLCEECGTAANVFVRYRLLLKFVLYLANCCTKAKVYDVADQIMENIQNGWQIDFTMLLLQYFFMYPVLYNYEVFKAIDVYDIKTHYLIVYAKLSYKLIERPLPTELQNLATLSLVKLPDKAPPRDHISVVLLRSNGDKLGTGKSFLCENRSVAPYSEFLVDFMSEDFYIFMQMLPYYINSDSIDMTTLMRYVPKQFYYVLYYARKLCGDNDDCIVDYVAVSHHLQYNGSATVLFYILSRSDTALNCEYLDFLSQMSQYYGETLYDNLGQSLAFMRLQFADDANSALLYKEVSAITGQYLAYVSRQTGFPFVHYFKTPDVDYRYLQLRSGFQVRAYDMYHKTATGNRTLQLFTTANMVSGNPEYETSNATATRLKILRVFWPDKFEELCELATQHAIFPSMAHYVKDENEHEDDYNKSMSNEDNNVHPYRGHIDEMNEQNAEFDEALTEFYARYLPSEKLIASSMVFRAMTSDVLGITHWNAGFYQLHEYFGLVNEKLCFANEAPMICSNMLHLQAHQSDCAIQMFARALSAQDLSKFGKIERK